MADYGSDLRDQAQILALLQEYDLAESEQVKRMFALADRLNSRRWLSTQERNALFMAARAQLRTADSNWQAELQSSGQSIPLSADHSLQLLDEPQLRGWPKSDNHKQQRPVPAFTAQWLPKPSTSSRWSCTEY